MAAPGVAERKAAAPRAAPTVRKAPTTGDIVLAPGISTTDAFKAIAGTLVGLIEAQRPAVSKRDPTGVHQRRIALRRTRAW